MNAEENLVLQGVKLELANLALEISRWRSEAEHKSEYSALPAWITLEQAAALKGGPALNTYRQKPFLQPCCGRNWTLVGGRHCWARADVILWLGITDASLGEYAAIWKAKLPDVYQERSA